MGEDPYLLFPESARDSVQSGTKRQMATKDEFVIEIEDLSRGSS